MAYSKPRYITTALECFFCECPYNTAGETFLCVGDVQTVSSVNGAGRAENLVFVFVGHIARFLFLGKSSLLFSS
jgi:hypothetical protein